MYAEFADGCECDRFNEKIMRENDGKPVDPRRFQMVEWVPVTERLPELHSVSSDDPEDFWEYQSSDYVLAVTADGVKMVEYCVDDCRIDWVEEGGTCHKSVTHWMPLPTPPKEATP